MIGRIMQAQPTTEVQLQRTVNLKLGSEAGSKLHINVRAVTKGMAVLVDRTQLLDMTLPLTRCCNSKSKQTRF